MVHYTGTDALLLQKKLSYINIYDSSCVRMYPKVPVPYF